MAVKGRLPFCCTLRIQTHKVDKPNRFVESKHGLCPFSSTLKASKSLRKAVSARLSHWQLLWYHIMFNCSIISLVSSRNLTWAIQTLFLYTYYMSISISKYNIYILLLNNIKHIYIQYMFIYIWVLCGTWGLEDACMPVQKSELRWTKEIQRNWWKGMHVSWGVAIEFSSSGFADKISIQERFIVHYLGHRHWVKASTQKGDWRKYMRQYVIIVGFEH